jgi:hypothetical protein
MKFKDREKGYSLIWRADRNRFLLKWRAPDGSPIRWPSKMLPDEFNREEHRRAALHWVENFLPTATVKAFVRKPGPRTGGLRVAEIETSWLKIQKERVDNNKIAPSTYGNYVTHLKRHIVPLLGTRRPYECDVPALLAFVRELPKRLDPRSKKPIGANHCWNILKTLTVFLDGCQDEGFVPAFTNYARSKRVLDEMPARTKSNPVALAVAAAQALIDCTDVPFIRRVKYALAFTSSMADGEISGLNIGDIDLGDVELPTASIKRACRAEGKEGHAEIGPPKNEHRLRVVPCIAPRSGRSSSGSPKATSSGRAAIPPQSSRSSPGSTGSTRAPTPRSISAKTCAHAVCPTRSTGRTSTSTRRAEAARHGSMNSAPTSGTGSG